MPPPSRAPRRRSAWPQPVGPAAVMADAHHRARLRMYRNRDLFLIHRLEIARLPMLIWPVLSRTFPATKLTGLCSRKYWPASASALPKCASVNVTCSNFDGSIASVGPRRNAIRFRARLLRRQSVFRRSPKCDTESCVSPATPAKNTATARIVNPAIGRRVDQRRSAPAAALSAGSTGSASSPFSNPSTCSRPALAPVGNQRHHNRQHNDSRTRRARKPEVKVVRSAKQQHRAPHRVHQSSATPA